MGDASLPSSPNAGGAPARTIELRLNLATMRSVQALASGQGSPIGQRSLASSRILFRLPPAPGVVTAFPSKVPSAYVLGDALLACDKHCDGMLLRLHTAGGPEKAAQALQEGFKLKRLVQHLRRLWRNCPRGGSPEVNSLKGFLVSGPPSSGRTGGSTSTGQGDSLQESVADASCSDSDWESESTSSSSSTTSSSVSSSTSDDSDTEESDDPEDDDDMVDAIVGEQLVAQPIPGKPVPGDNASAETAIVDASFEANLFGGERVEMTIADASSEAEVFGNEPEDMAIVDASSEANLFGAPKDKALSNHLGVAYLPPSAWPTSRASWPAGLVGTSGSRRARRSRSRTRAHGRRRRHPSSARRTPPCRLLLQARLPRLPMRRTTTSQS